MCICEGVCVCVRDRKTGFVCSHLAVCQKARFLVLFFLLQRMNIKSSVYSLEVIFPTDFTPPLPLVTQKRNTRPIRIFGKEEIGYEQVIWKHLWPQSLPPLFLLGSVHQQTLAQRFHSSRS